MTALIADDARQGLGCLHKAGDAHRYHEQGDQGAATK
jgi:hypothetical protein